MDRTVLGSRLGRLRLSLRGAEDPAASSVAPMKIRKADEDASRCIVRSAYGPSGMAMGAPLSTIITLRYFPSPASSLSACPLDFFRCTVTYRRA